MENIQKSRKLKKKNAIFIDFQNQDKKIIEKITIK